MAVPTSTLRSTDAVDGRHVGHELLIRIGLAAAIVAGKRDGRAVLVRVIMAEAVPSAEEGRQPLLRIEQVIFSDKEVVAFDVGVPAELCRSDEGVGGRAGVGCRCGYRRVELLVCWFAAFVNIVSVDAVRGVIREGVGATSGGLRGKSEGNDGEDKLHGGGLGKKGCGQRSERDWCTRR
jgi:hypothetical protein